MSKNNRGTWFLVLLAAAVLLAAGFFFGRERHGEPSPADTPAASVQAPPTQGFREPIKVAAVEEVAKKTQYTCGMHPFIIQDEPGDCPICGMKLTPVKAGGAATSAAGSVTIDPATIQNMGVRTAPVQRRDLARTIRTVGLVTYDEPRQYSLNSKIEGWVERLHVNQSGQPVNKGQPLLEIYSPELVAAQEEYLLALANRGRLETSPFAEIAEGAARLLEAARSRLRYWDISEAQIRKLETNGEVRRTMTIHSPYQGVVTDKKVVEGMRVMAGQELLQIADLRRVWVNADLYEFELPWVRQGLTAEVELPFTGEKKGNRLTGTITYIYPYLQGETRTARARIEFANPDLALKPGMYANVLIRSEAIPQALVVPEAAVLAVGASHRVFVALGEGRFEPREVTTGLHDDQGFIQITNGLAEGEPVVVSAQFLFDSESKLQEALRKMRTPEADLDDLFK